MWKSKNTFFRKIISIAAMILLIFLCSSSVGYPQRDEITRLIGELKDQDPKVRAGAARALGRPGGIKDTRAVEPLIAALKDQDPKVRASAARAFSWIEDVRSISPLYIAMIDEDEIVRLWAKIALEIPSKDKKELYNEKNVPDVEPFIAALSNKDPDIRQKAAWVLEKTTDSRAINALNTAIREKNLEIIAGAYLFFIRKGESGTEDLLIEALNKCGDIQIAQCFLNSGNARLRAAGEEWAKKKRFTIREYNLMGEGSLRWGGTK